MNLTKSFLFLLIVVVVSFLGLSGCYTQLATSSDNPEPVNNSQTAVTEQPPPTTVIIVNPVVDPPPEPYYPHPWYPPPPGIDHPHQWNSTPSAVSTSTVTGTDAPPESPHRQSGYQRSSSTDQNNSRQTDATPPRTSWSPAPASTPSAPTPSSDSETRTSGSTRKSR